MELLDLEKIQFFFLFSVPGIVALYTRSQFIDGKMPKLSDGISIYVALSLIYHAFWFILLPSLYSYKFLTASLYQKLQWFGIIFVGPAAIGLWSAVNVRYEWTQRLFQKLGMYPIHPVGTAWDWKFSRTPESWVLVKLKDGTIWRGVLGPNSFISSSPQERDIFVEKVYKINENSDSDEWIERDSSVLITHDQVQSIEFWPKGVG
ncbi:MAG: hypothetical protein RL186_1114 [Pseudomonadota bacterium]|jgi:hypothetical protein